MQCIQTMGIQERRTATTHIRKSSILALSPSSLLLLLVLMLHILPAVGFIVIVDAFRITPLVPTTALLVSISLPKKKNQRFRKGFFTRTSLIMTSSPSLSKDEIYAMECDINHTTCTVQEAISEDGTMITILGFGSLLSEKSSRLTFPTLSNFRLVRVPNYQRMFAHPTSIFFQRNIANLSTLEMASLSCEYHPNCSFIATAFDIPVSEMMDITTNTYTPKIEFVQREEEFAIIPVPYLECIDDISNEQDMVTTKRKVGMICAKSNDDIYLAKWGKDHFQLRYQQYGLSTIWNYPSTFVSIKPCTIYLYHCYTASKNMGKECHDSFLDETYLVDRTTTLRQYLMDYPTLFHNLQIPPELHDRYCG